MFFERMIQLLIKEKEQFLHMTWREKLRIEITLYDFNTEFFLRLRVFVYRGNKVRIKLSLERTNCMFDRR